MFDATLSRVATGVFTVLVFIPMTAEASVNSVTVNRVYDGHLMQMIGLACWNTADARPVVRAAAQHEPLSAW